MTPTEVVLNAEEVKSLPPMTIPLDLVTTLRQVVAECVSNQKVTNWKHLLLLSTFMVDSQEYINRCSARITAERRKQKHCTTLPTPLPPRKLATVEEHGEDEEEKKEEE